MCIKIKSKLSYLRIVLFLTGFVFVGCAMKELKMGMIFRQEFIKL